MKNIRTSLIEAGIKNLKEFGYPSVTADNILTDMLYSQFFLSMLNDNKGHSISIDEEIDKLIAEININGNK